MNKKNALPVILFLLVAVLGCGQRKSDSSRPPETPAPPGQYTDAEKKYMGGALSYIVNLQGKNQQVAIAMSGASNGSTTLGEIKEEIESAQTAENTGYYVTYLGNPVPSNLQDVHAKIDGIHNMHAAVYAEYLEYWRDGNMAHIQSATAKFKRALQSVNDTAKYLNAKMDAKLQERENTNIPTQKKKGSRQKVREYSPKNN